MGDQNDQKELEKLLQDNLKYSKVIYERIRKIEKAITWMKVFSILRIIIIVVPIVLAILYLPPLWKKTMQKYQGLLGRDQTHLLRQLDNLKP